VSSFEFILISIAIVVGFGISEVLAGWGQQLRLRRELHAYPLQIVASVYLLSLSLRFVWNLWALQGVVWTFLGYLLVFLPALVLALSAHLLRVDVLSLRRTPRAQYFAVQRPLFGLLALFPIFAGAGTFYGRVHLQPTFGDNVLLLGLLPFAVCSFAWMMLSENPRHHWIAWTVVWAVHIAISLMVLPTLATP